MNWPIKELPDLLAHLKRCVRPEQLLFGLSYQQYRAAFLRAAEVAGCACLLPHPYSVRHGGASHEVYLFRRPRQDAQKKGRWRTHTSVARYEKKHARLLKQLAAMPDESRRHADHIEWYLVPLLLSKRRAPAPPFWSVAPRKAWRRGPAASAATP